MPPKPKEESANLIRVRNNQRRSRARRREYIAELERKLEDCKANGPPARDVIPRDTIHKLKEENRKLRELLDLVGVKQALVDAHVGAPIVESDSHGPSPPEPAGEVMGVGYDPLKSTNLLTIREGHEESDDLLAASFPHLPDDEFDFSLNQETFAFDPSLVPEAFNGDPLPFPHDTAMSPSPPCPLPAIPLPCCPDESHLPTSSGSERDMTLCSVAYDMIRQQNKRGIDMIEIGIRLWNGFVKGEGGRGCKVENDLLYSVLEYIKC